MSRYIYTKFFGEIPEGMFVCHKCDNPECINPEHLFLGTQKDNLHDMQNKGRKWAPKGSDHPRVKLTEKQVKDIRNDSRTYRELAKEYNVHHNTIWSIKAKKTWK